MPLFSFLRHLFRRRLLFPVDAYIWRHYAFILRRATFIASISSLRRYLSRRR